MKKIFKKYSREIIFTGVIILSFCLIALTMLLVRDYSASFNEQVETRAALYTTQTTDSLTTILRKTETQSLELATKLKEAKDENDIVNIFDALELENHDEENENNPIYFSHEGIIYNIQGAAWSKEASENFLSSLKPCVGDVTAENTSALTKIATEEFGTYLVVGQPVNSKFIDNIFLYYRISYIAKYILPVEKNECVSKAEFVALCGNQGTILDKSYDPLKELSLNNILDQLLGRTNNSKAVNAIEKFMNSSTGGEYCLRINGESYVVSVGVNSTNRSVCTVAMYKESDIYASGYKFITMILTAIVIIFLILICFSVYFILYRKMMRRKIADYGKIDEKLGCSTIAAFEKEAAQTIAKYRSSEFVIVSAKMKHFHYISETYGAEVADEILLFLKALYEKFVHLGEAYAYDTDGEFVLLLHYKRVGFITDRLNSLYMLAQKNSPSEKLNVRLVFGVYIIDRKKEISVKKMVEKAIIARDTKGLEQLNDIVLYYKDSLMDTYMQNSDLETKMETALKNNEFEVFYQPKLNTVLNHIDSSEALVRWKNVEQGGYRQPGEFLPLFESNGFIIKLDRFVYYKVCEFLRKRIDMQTDVYPVSVNISRVSALQEDFITYYAKIKKQFGIADKFITLELTESVAYENYDRLNKIVEDMHKNGFLCSIDDFGTGYSSYKTLKQLNVDEIKLDKIFIEPGLSEEKDRKILESIVNACNQLHIKVVQEGVENLNIMELLKSVGCTIIQGYYYSKALAEADFARFMIR